MKFQRIDDTLFFSPTIHRTNTGKEKVDDKAPRVLRPADTIVHTREDGPTVQRCGDNEVAGKWING